MTPRPIDPEEAKWRRRSDARTLAEAEEIKADKERYRGAITGAKEMAQEEINRVKGIAKIAGMKLPNAPHNDVEGNKNNVPNAVKPFDKRGYKNPATIGRF